MAVMTVLQSVATRTNRQAQQRVESLTKYTAFSFYQDIDWIFLWDGVFLFVFVFLINIPQNNVRLTKGKEL